MKIVVIGIALVSAVVLYLGLVSRGVRLGIIRELHKHDRRSGHGS